MKRILIRPTACPHAATGAPVSSFMVSLDGALVWRDHRAIADRSNFKWTSVREISPGRLLYMCDARIPAHACVDKLALY
jgi:hypothetical protein